MKTPCLKKVWHCIRAKSFCLSSNMDKGVIIPISGVGGYFFLNQGDNAIYFLN